MGSRKDLNISGLSKWRYRELKYFCLQYPEWKEKLSQEREILIKAVHMTDMPKGNALGNTTENTALKRVILEEKCKIVEQSAIQADAEIYSWILENVTLGIPYEWLDVPCGRRRFYAGRINFFNILDKKGN